MMYENDNDYFNKTYWKFDNPINQNTNIIHNRKRAAAIKLPGAEAEVANAKVKITTLMNDLRHDADKLDSELKRIADNNSATVNSIRIQKDDIEVLKKQVADARTLNEIRKEQVESLKKKHEAGFHSSYLGLWVPLREHTRVSLLVVSIFLILLGIVASVFIRWTLNFPDKPINPPMGGFIAYSRRK